MEKEAGGYFLGRPDEWLLENPGSNLGFAAYYLYGKWPLWSSAPSFLKQG